MDGACFGAGMVARKVCFQGSEDDKDEGRVVGEDLAEVGWSVCGS